MDQVYFVGKPDADGRRSVFYRYGNFCYADTMRVDNCNDMRKLPTVMQFLQSVQVLTVVYPVLVRSAAPLCPVSSRRRERACDVVCLQPFFWGGQLAAYCLLCRLCPDCPLALQPARLPSVMNLNCVLPYAAVTPD